MLRKIYDDKIEVFTNALGRIDERMYAVKRDSELILVDPNICEELLEWLNKWQVTNCIILLTHEHYDHITGVKWFLQHKKATVICSSECDKMIHNPLITVQEYYDILLQEEDRSYYFGHDLQKQDSYIFNVDTTFESSYSFLSHGIRIRCLSAPGHSVGGAIYFMDDKYVFTGDNLVNGNKVITRFPGGNKKDYLQITKPIIENLSEDCVIFPGHGEMGKLNEFRQFLIS